MDQLESNDSVGLTKPGWPEMHLCVHLLVFTTHRGAVTAILMTPAIEPNSRSFSGDGLLLENAVRRP